MNKEKKRPVFFIFCNLKLQLQFVKTTKNTFDLISGISRMGPRLFGLADSVWAVLVWVVSVWAVSVWGHFGQTMKSCRNLTCSHLMQTYLNQWEVSFKKRTNMIQDPTVDQHQHWFSLSSATKLSNYRHFAIKYKFFKVIITIQI